MLKKLAVGTLRMPKLVCHVKSSTLLHIKRALNIFTEIKMYHNYAQILLDEFGVGTNSNVSPNEFTTFRILVASRQTQAFAHVNATI